MDFAPGQEHVTVLGMAQESRGNVGNKAPSGTRRICQSRSAQHYRSPWWQPLKNGSWQEEHNGSHS